MWEGFDGHPLRKDWREAYFEEETKPFKSRWPGGQVWRSEEKSPFGKNVDYPAGFDPETWVPDVDAALYAGLGKIEAYGNGSEMKTDQVIVNLGPQHPSTHGVFRMVATLDGETVLALKPVWVISIVTMKKLQNEILSCRICPLQIDWITCLR
jgi:NADH-quinone oxidoreductase subunit D/NADH-quinone oxidoreductase subunit C/D